MDVSVPLIPLPAPPQPAPPPAAAPASGANNMRTTSFKVRAIVGGTLVLGAISSMFYTIYSSVTMRNNPPTSRFAYIGPSLALWGGGVAGASLLIPTNISTRLQAVSVIGRRMLGTALSIAGPFAADAIAQSLAEQTQNEGNANYFGPLISTFGTMFGIAGIGVAFGPEGCETRARQPAQGVVTLN